MKPHFFSPVSVRRVHYARVLGAAGLLLFFAPVAQGQPADGAALMVPDEAVVTAAPTNNRPQTAAQQAGQAAIEKHFRDRDQWRAYRQLTAGEKNVSETQNTAVVLAQYQGWLDTHPDLHPAVVAEAGILISRLQRKSADAPAADATLSALWDKTKESDGGLSVRAEQARVMLVGAKGEGKAVAGAKAQALLEPLVDRALISSGQLRGSLWLPASELLQQYSEALAAQNKGLELSSFARRLMVDAPWHLAGGLQNGNGWLYRVTIETLASDARAEARQDALSWARLNWVERPFDARGVSDASKLVAQGLLAQPNGAELLSQWAKAQKDPTLPNPLREVALPATDAGALERVLETLGSGDQDRETRVGVLLWLGRDRAAMEAAIAGADKLPENATGARQNVMKQVARVFKAHDLGIKGANAYLLWASKGEGANPLEAFFDAVPAATQVAGGTP